jgi:hypothetical protein
MARAKRTVKHHFERVENGPNWVKQRAFALAPELNFT